MKRFIGGLALSALLSSPTASAYCRATTCDPGDPQQHCQVDARSQCTLSGSPLYWASGCITVNVQQDGAPLARISADQAQASVERALHTWLSVDCGGAGPALRATVGQQIECGRAEYSTDHHNANVVLFREGSWPYAGAADALGVTWLHFDDEQAPGQLWDADIEINAVTEPLSAGHPNSDEADLDSVLTHEIGHLLGLGHTLDVEATMAAGYVPGSTELRSLAEDDKAGICAIYPPDRQLASSSCEPRHGFSEQCAEQQPPFVEPMEEPQAEPAIDRTSDGCAVSSHQPGTAPIWLGLVGLALVLRRRYLRR